MNLLQEDQADQTIIQDPIRTPYHAAPNHAYELIWNYNLLKYFDKKIIRAFILKTNIYLNN